MTQSDDAAKDGGVHECGQDVRAHQRRQTQ
jgi:hypothetical protein